MAKLTDLSREYEERHYPALRRLDLHGEGPRAARDRALRWIQGFAHEEPGSDLLLIVERGVRPGHTGGPVRRAVESLLRHLEGRLIEWWQPFGPGSLAVRIAIEPRMVPPRSRRTPASATLLQPDTGTELPPEDEADIPPDLLPVARRAAELRRMREGLSVRITEVLLHQVWIEAQAAAMHERIGWDAAFQRVLEREERLAYEEE